MCRDYREKVGVLTLSINYDRTAFKIKKIKQAFCLNQTKHQNEIVNTKTVFIVLNTNEINNILERQNDL